MFEQLALLWQFLLAQPPAAAVRLVSWHLLALLMVLGALSAFGLHFLAGHVFGFYRRKERLARWISLPTLLVFLVSVQLLLGAYLLGVQADALVRGNLNIGVAAQLGRNLLKPAFETAVLALQHPEEVSKDAIKTALRGVPELEYRQRLSAELAALQPAAPQPAAPPADESAAGTGGRPALLPPDGPALLVRIGLHWITDPHNTLFATIRTAEPSGGKQDPFFLPDFLAGLVDELQDGTVLPRADWEHVAGTRYVEGVLRPLMEEYLSYLAIALAVLVGLFNVLYFLLMRRLKRIGQPRAAARKPAPAPARKPVPVPAAPPAPPPSATSAGAGAPVPRDGDAAPPAAKADATPPAKPAG